MIIHPLGKLSHRAMSFTVIALNPDREIVLSEDADDEDICEEDSAYAALYFATIGVEYLAESWIDDLYLANKVRKECNPYIVDAYPETLLGITMGIVKADLPTMKQITVRVSIPLQDGIRNREIVRMWQEGM